jgi:hypothetical protein
MQRQFGKLLHKGPGENAKVAVLLNDYEDADHVLAQVGNLETEPECDCTGRNSVNSVYPDHRECEDVEGFVGRSYQHPIAGCDRV